MTDKSELTIEQCATQASQCRELGRQTMSPPHRIMLEHIARTWERIGIDIQRRGDRNTDAGYDFKV
jgi:hypothetical protein